MDTRKQDRFWNQLLLLIAKKNVVPVVGEDMLFLTEQSKINMYGELALRYAKYAELDQPKNRANDLSSTVRSHPEFRGNPYDVYQEVGEEYELWDPPIPVALCELAKIRHFSLFVSTTFDNLLERAINKERFGGKRLTIVLTYSPKTIPTDTQVSQALNSGKPVIFQLFGNLKNPLQFALTEGDKVEYMHALQSTEYCPKRMLAELQEKPLLLLGNNFPDWLARSFLRMTRKTPLDHRDVPKQYFADSVATENVHLKSFLKSFTTNTEVVDGSNPIQFTQELTTKWLEKYPDDEKMITKHASLNLDNKPMPPNAVFISYCSQDSDQAALIKQALENAGISVWMDRDQLRAGDKYERKIERYINTCSLFIPLISPISNSRVEGFFRQEWSWALRRLPTFTGSSRQFILPVALGNINPYTAKIPDAFKSFQFFKLSDDTPDNLFVGTVKSVYDEILAVQSLGEAI